MPELHMQSPHSRPRRVKDAAAGACRRTTSKTYNNFIRPSSAQKINSDRRMYLSCCVREARLATVVLKMCVTAVY